LPELWTEAQRSLFLTHSVHVITPLEDSYFTR